MTGEGCIYDVKSIEIVEYDDYLEELIMRTEESIGQNIFG